MKTNKIIVASAAALTLSLGASISSLAHTGHDHSNLTLNWTFTKDSAQKISQAMGSEQNRDMKGLSKFEQKKLDHYGIKVGNTFKSVINGKPVQIKRTTMGVEIGKANLASLASAWQIPLRKTNSIVLASTGNHQHHGHDHSQLPYEWEFSVATENKINDRMVSNPKDGFVGLTRFEQKLLDRYGIKVGNKFQSIVDGQKVIVERTSAGIRTINSSTNMSVASSMEHSSM